MRIKECKAIIEMPAGSVFKYEQDQQDMCLVLDRSLDVRVPENYGYIQDTVSEDGDSLDVFVLTAGEPLAALSRVPIQIIAGFECEDNGVSDPKLIAVLADADWDDEALQERIEAVLIYLHQYKEGFEVGKELTENEAFRLYLNCREAA